LREQETKLREVYQESTQQLIHQHTLRESEYEKLCALCKEYKAELEEGRRQSQEMRAQLGTMGRLTARIEDLQSQVCCPSLASPHWTSATFASPLSFSTLMTGAMLSSDPSLRHSLR
jgi:predicted nuclease with TOPRIM domain